jgi:Histidine kinase
VNDDKIDWSQLWYPGPTRLFSAAELERAGGSHPSRTLVAMVMINLAIAAMLVLQAAPPRATPVLTALMVAAAAVALPMGLRLWRHPTRRRLWVYSAGYTLTAGVIAGVAQARFEDKSVGNWIVIVSIGAALLASAGLWFVTVYRAHQVAARLVELDERERREEMARQLAQAQIQPHFLFNSLASLQHWVQTKDDRAAPLLGALTGFLRATLPLFDRRTLRVAEEAQAVREYLTVMQLRLGERLRWQLAIDPAAADAALPPGLLLTLVENAIEHGVQKRLAGGQIMVRAQATGARLIVEVQDTGPGLGGGARDGVGLGNARARLAQAFGGNASLILSDTGDGCLARIETCLRIDTTP